ncbi:Hypothetical predicted protein [Mytilus galloprovincialis]|uniref:Mab-21-like HhH/H2TH-like domain-containing protein n=1 Tax=Mytilus galloprovincialis TaxID=29158 RepID=A0A8B6EFU5_MYTGA|nr:Hypothetical predicted protein [Mytilus galloprovincialis]
MLKIFVSDLSLRLYHYLCKYIIGTEHHVKTIRLLNTVGDNLSRNDSDVAITSGSFGEGLQIRGSDLDIIYVLQDIEVQDNISPIAFNANKTNFSMMTEDTKPGFAMLRLITTNFHHEFIPECCKQFRRHIYLSNVLFKNMFLNDMCSVVHGPCVSDKTGSHDIAYCLHSKYWVISALQWTMRSNNVWPSENTKQMIINHGVLFVPIGNKESVNEEFEWRMSFSVGEKFLMYTLSHTQLLCYALMKILLKDVINTDSRCKKLLCSYYIKTIMFWISEEFQPSVWTPCNLIPCFMRCLRRLIYCVQYQVCPHYFIPENNLFENMIDSLDRDSLIDTLRLLFSYGWRCILFSKNISYVSVLSCNIKFFNSCLYFDDFNKLLLSKIFLRVSSVSSRNNYNRAIYYSLDCNSKKLKYIHAYFISAVCSKHCPSLYLSKTIGNKNKYREYNTCLSYLLMSINHDIVSGWMMIASFFYKANQYQKSLMISSYALSKCTLEKSFRGTELSVIQRFAIKRDEIRKQGVVHSLKFILVDFVLFTTSTLIPMELLIEGKSFELPPVFCAHFLSFLSHYHMQNVKECQSSLLDLQLTIAENYFMGKDTCATAFSYYCLGTALQIIGDNKAAKQAFTKTVKLLHPYPQVIKRLKRLYLTASL